MRKGISCLALWSLVLPGPAFAAEDMRLTPHGSRTMTSPATGFGAGITLKLGEKRREAAPRLSLSIGPSVSTEGRHRVMDLGRLTVTDAGTLTASFAGRALSQEPVLGAAEEGGRKGPSSLGWAAIAIGAVLVVGSVGLFIAARSVQDE